MARIDKRTLLRELTRIVKANPTKRASCVYVMGGKPECVAGVWFDTHKVKVDLLPNNTVEGLFESLASNTNSYYASSNESRTKEAFESFDLDGLSPSAQRLLAFIQAVQDDRLSEAGRLVIGSEDIYGKTGDAWVAKAKELMGQQNVLQDYQKPLWSQALALTVENYSAF